MDIQHLFSGTGVVIDDKVHDNESGDRITQIVSFLETDCHIPLVKYDTLPAIETVKHFHSVSFILLDWNLFDLPPGITGDVKDKNEDIINFLKSIQETCYIPVFVFTNEEIDKVQQTLYSNQINKVPLFFKHKSSLIVNGKVVFWDLLYEWLNEKCGLYVMKEWEASFYKARNDFMTDSGKKNQHWPKSILESSELDSTDASVEISDLITQNLISRMGPIPFDVDQINNDPKPVLINDIRPVLELQRFCTTISSFDSTGDFYRKPDGTYYLNIRPACDCVPRKNFDHNLYLIKCNPCNIKGKIDAIYGFINEKVDEAIIGPINDGKYYSASFKTLRIISLANMKDESYTRIGRLLPPFITVVVQKYGVFVQRSGLPRLPLKAIYSPEELLQMKSESQENSDATI